MKLKFDQSSRQLRFPRCVSHPLSRKTVGHVQCDGHLNQARSHSRVCLGHQNNRHFHLDVCVYDFLVTNSFPWNGATGGVFLVAQTDSWNNLKTLSPLTYLSKLPLDEKQKDSKNVRSDWIPVYWFGLKLLQLSQTWSNPLCQGGSITVLIRIPLQRQKTVCLGTNDSIRCVHWLH